MIGIGLEMDYSFGAHKSPAAWIAKKTGAGFSSMLSSMEDEARARAPRRSGRLIQMIRAHRVSPLNGYLLSAASYSSYLHEGTGVFGPEGNKIVIRPQRKSALWFRGAGHPAGRAFIRGIRPRDFMRAPFEDAFIKEAFGHVFKKEDR